MEKNNVNGNEAMEIDLLELAKVLLSHIWILITCSLIAGIIAACVAVFVLPLKYQSYTTMYVKNNSDPKTEQTIEINDINASKSLASTYIAVLKNDAVMKEVSNRLIAKYEKEKYDIPPEALEYTEIKKYITMSTVDDTELLEVRAKTIDPRLSADICNTIDDIAPSFLIRIVGAGSVEVINYADVNDDPVEPNVKKMIVLGLMLGFMAAAGIIVFLYLIDNSVKSTDELNKRFNKAIIGEVYNFSQEKGEKRKKLKKGEHRAITPENLLNDQTVFTVAESYKTMRTNAVFALSPFNDKVFAVTSVNAAEGKSMTVANLAISFALTESKVLLIDADMRKPTQHKLFQVKNEKGLSSAISKMNRLEECIHQGVRKNLDLMPSGAIPPNPSELLDSGQFETIIDKLKSEYDYIIIDTPPVNVVSDVLVMAKSISGVMFVAKHGSTTYENIEEAMKKLRLAEIKMLGFILNNIVMSSGGKYYNSYKYKYGYKYGYSYSYSENDENGENTKKEKK